MNLYLIEYICQMAQKAWPGRAVVKAESASHAWERFRDAWVKDLASGKTDVPLSAIVKFSVLSFCLEKDVLL